MTRLDFLIREKRKRRNAKRKVYVNMCKVAHDCAIKTKRKLTAESVPQFSRS